MARGKMLPPPSSRRTSPADRATDISSHTSNESKPRPRRRRKIISDGPKDITRTNSLTENKDTICNISDIPCRSINTFSSSPDGLKTRSPTQIFGESTDKENIHCEDSMVLPNERKNKSGTPNSAKQYSSRGKPKVPSGRRQASSIRHKQSSRKPESLSQSEFQNESSNPLASPSSPSALKSLITTKNKKEEKSPLPIMNTKSILQNANTLCSNPVSSTKLLNIIANAALSFPISPSQGAILLEEKQIEIVNIARRCLRVAASTSPPLTNKNGKSEGNNEMECNNRIMIKIANLRMAFYCLRSIAPIFLTDISEYEKTVPEEIVQQTLKLLYHCIVTAETIYLELVRRMTKEPAGYVKFPAAGFHSVSESESVATICFAAYQVLGMILSSILGQEVILPRLLATGSDANQILWNVFPIPRQNKDNKTVVEIIVSSSETNEGMSREQIEKIAIKSILAVFTVGWDMHIRFLKEQCKAKCESNREVDKNNFFADSFTEFGLDIQGLVTNSAFSYETHGDDQKQNCGNERIHSFHHILTSITMPWVVSSIQGGIINFKDEVIEQQMDNVIVNAKRIHKILWDAASQVDKLYTYILNGKAKECSSVEYHIILKSLQDYVLNLRSDSIMVLSLNSLQLNGEWVCVSKSINEAFKHKLEKEWEYCCNIARKTAASFSQHSSNSSYTDLTLRNFHNLIGRVLDRNTCVQEDSSNLPYIEYCAYRSSQSASAKTFLCKNETCIFSYFPFQFAHSTRSCCMIRNVERSSSAGSISLAFFFLGLFAKQCALGQRDHQNATALSENLNSLEKSIIEIFCSIFCKQMDDVRFLIRVQKMISSLKLEVVAFKTTRDIKTVSSITQARGLAILGRLLGQCCGPLNLAIVERSEASGKDGLNKKPIFTQADNKNYFDFAIENYLRAINVYDFLSDLPPAFLKELEKTDRPSVETSLNDSGVSDLGKHYADRSETYMHVIFSKLMNGPVECNMLEMVAKTLFNIAKRKLDRKDDFSSLIPLILSLELFSKAFLTTINSDYQLSARYIRLASVMRSLDLIDESCVALCFAIKYQLLEYSVLPVIRDVGKNEENKVSDMVLLCDKYISGEANPASIFWRKSHLGSSIQSLVNKLIRVHTSRNSRNAGCTRSLLNEFPKDTITTLKFGVALQKISQIKTPIVLSYIFRTTILEDELIGRTSLPHKIGTVYKLLEHLGRTLLERDSITGGDHTSSMHNAVDQDFELLKNIDMISKYSVLLLNNDNNKLTTNLHIEYTTGLYISSAAALSSPSSKKNQCIPSDYIMRSFQYLKKAEGIIFHCFNDDTTFLGRVKFHTYTAAIMLGIEEILETQKDGLQSYVETHINYDVGTLTLPPTKRFRNPYEKIASQCSEAVSIINSENGPRWRLLLPEKFIFHLLSIVVKVYRKLEYQGASIPAARHSKNLFQFLVNNTMNRENDDGLKSIVGSVLLRGELYGDLMSLLFNEEMIHPEYLNEKALSSTNILLERLKNIYPRSHSMPKENCHNILHSLASSLLLHSVELHAFIETTEPKYLPSALAFLSKISRTLDNASIFEIPSTSNDYNESTDYDHIDNSFWVILQWWKSSLILALAEGYERCGHFSHSLQHARTCCQLSREVLNFTKRRVHPCFADVINYGYGLLSLSLSTFTLPFSGRISHCLCLLGKLYSRLGDHRKAKNYVILSSQELDLQPCHLSRDTSINDILEYTHSHVVTIRQMKYRRSIIASFSHLIPPGMLNDGVRDKVRDWLNKICAMSSEQQEVKEDSTNTLYTDNLDWIRETIRDLICVGEIIELQSNDSSEARVCYEGALNLSRQLWAHAPLSDCTISSPLNGMPVAKSSLSKKSKVKRDPDQYAAFGNTLCERDIQIAKILSRSLSKEERSTSMCILDSVSQSRFASSTCRAQALYNLGMGYLREARQNGELHDLWRGLSFTQRATDKVKYCPDINPGAPPSSLKKSRSLFLEAASFAGPASSLLSRQVLRCLALVMGPENISDGTGMTAGELVHASIGSSARQAVSRACTSSKLDQHTDSCLSKEDITAILSAFDLPIDNNDNGQARSKAIANMYKIGSNIIPRAWKFLALTICPTGDLLISLLEQSDDDLYGTTFKSCTVCIFEDNKDIHEISQSQIYKDILYPFEKIMANNRSHLSGMNTTSANGISTNDTDTKRQWWDDRIAMNNQLQDLLDLLDRNFFRVDCVKKSILGRNIYTGGSYFNEPKNKELHLHRENLSAMFEAACTIEEKGHQSFKNDFEKDGSLRDEISLKKMTVVQLKSELKDYGVEAKTMRALRKAALIDLLVMKQKEELMLTDPCTKSSTKSEVSCTDVPFDIDSSDQCFDASTIENRHSLNDECTFLILDENLLHLPIEGTNSFKSKTVCRIPSLPFAIISVLESDGANSVPTVDASNASYVLDPESNLPGTQKTLFPAFESLSERNQCSWKGVVGKFPEEEFMESALTRKNGLFIYCGHGGGERFFSRSRIENLMYGESSSKVENGLNNSLYGTFRLCRSSLILMGCSSGKLSSVNTPKGSFLSNSSIYYEPEGISLSYLCAGAPCVVSNLWDVTDRDIDRYFLTLLDKLFGIESNGGNMNLARCVAESREACKMQYIVGCAPVVYGVPVKVARYEP